MPHDGHHLLRLSLEENPSTQQGARSCSENLVTCGRAVSVQKEGGTELPCAECPGLARWTLTELQSSVILGVSTGQAAASDKLAMQWVGRARGPTRGGAGAEGGSRQLSPTPHALQGHPCPGPHWQTRTPRRDTMGD